MTAAAHPPQRLDPAGPSDELAGVRADAVRHDVSRRFGLGPEDAVLLTGDEKTMYQQAQRLTERDDEARRAAYAAGNHVPAEGTNQRPPKPSNHDAHEFVRELFDRSHSQDIR